jgi:hypothetical protein
MYLHSMVLLQLIDMLPYCLAVYAIWHMCLQERDAEKGRVDAERLASERAFYSELQVQEADAKSGGQRGMNQHRKKKK